MDRFALDAFRETEPLSRVSRVQGWQPPAFEVISLCCEITAYAPDDEPLF